MRLAHMVREHAIEDIRGCFHNLERVLPKGWLPTKEQEQVRHESRTQKKPAMLLLVLRETSGGQSIGQRFRLAKSERETFRSDGVNGA